MILVALAAAMPPVRSNVSPLPPLWGAVGPRVYDDVAHAYRWLEDGTLALAWRRRGDEVLVQESPDGVAWSDATGWLATDGWTDATPAHRYRLLWRTAAGGELRPSNVLWVGPRGVGPEWHARPSLLDDPAAAPDPARWDPARKSLVLTWFPPPGEAGTVRLERKICGSGSPWSVLLDWSPATVHTATDPAPILDGSMCYRLRWRDADGFEQDPAYVPVQFFDVARRIGRSGAVP